ncbi:MAG TPA: hypothetical protein VES97_05635 [Solirubrobacteraceae bacterium]|nr:hypothetical protein [Solirubrobacteraceae bacterium]
MSSPAARSAASTPLRHVGETLRVAFVGSPVWLDGCAPTQATHGLTPERFTIAATVDAEPTLAAIASFRPHVTVVFDPPSVPAEALRLLSGVTLGVLVAGAPEEGVAPALEELDRLVSFAPALTGAQVGRNEVWRAIPPPVGDTIFDAVRPLCHAPRAMSIGRSSAHREEMLMPAKHHHDLLQVIHGVSGEPLQELLRECDVGVFVAREPGGGFGPQVGMHLAAGHLLLAEELTPAHGLERNIDYLHVDSPDGLVWILERLGRFPEMYQRIRVRGRLKAEQYRASRLFRRLAYDLLADVAAFGNSRGVEFSS